MSRLVQCVIFFMFKDEVEEGPHPRSDEPAAAGDIECLMKQVAERSRNTSSGSASSTQADSLPVISTPTRGLGKRGKSTPSTPQEKTPDAKATFQTAATAYFNTLQERDKNPDTTFAKDLAEDLSQITNKQKKQILKHSIRELMHKALMEEWENVADKV